MTLRLSAPTIRQQGNSALIEHALDANGKSYDICFAWTTGGKSERLDHRLLVSSPEISKIMLATLKALPAGPLENYKFEIIEEGPEIRAEAYDGLAKVADLKGRMWLDEDRVLLPAGVTNVHDGLCLLPKLLKRVDSAFASVDAPPPSPPARHLTVESSPSPSPAPSAPATASSSPLSSVSATSSPSMASPALSHGSSPLPPVTSLRIPSTERGRTFRLPEYRHPDWLYNNYGGEIGRDFVEEMNRVMRGSAEEFWRELSFEKLFSHGEGMNAADRTKLIDHFKGNSPSLTRLLAALKKAYVELYQVKYPEYADRAEAFADQYVFRPIHQWAHISA